MKFISLLLIKTYQLFASPVIEQVFNVHCRYSLTCSEYAKKQIEKKGVLKGGLSALKRVASCQPFGNKYVYN